MGKSQGFVMIPRDMSKLSIWKNPQDVAILLYCVLHASYQDHGELKAGQFYTSRIDMADDLHMCRNTFSKHFASLVKRGYLFVEQRRRGTVITVLDWDHFAKGIDFFCEMNEPAEVPRTRCAKFGQIDAEQQAADAQMMADDAHNLRGACAKNDTYQYSKETEKALSVSPDQKSRKNAFAKWWSAYPRHNGEAAAFKAYMQHPATPEQLMKALENAKLSREWMDSNGRYIPSATKWLDGAWMDYLPTEIERMRKEHRECKTY